MQSVAIEKYYRENWKSVARNVGFATLYSFFATVVFMTYLHDIWYLLAAANAIVFGYFGALQQASIFKIERFSWIIVLKYSFFTFILMLTPEIFKAIGGNFITKNWILYGMVSMPTTSMYYWIVPMFASLFIGKNAVKAKREGNGLLFFCTLFLVVLIFFAATEALNFLFISFDFSNIVLWWINFIGCLIQSLFFVVGHAFLALYYNSNSARHNKG